MRGEVRSSDSMFKRRKERKRYALRHGFRKPSQPLGLLDNMEDWDNNRPAAAPLGLLDRKKGRDTPEAWIKETLPAPRPSG